MTIAQKNVRAMMLAAVGFSLYSFGDVFVKAQADNYEPYQIGFYINLFFLPLVLSFSSKLGGLGNALRTKNLKLHILRACCGLVTFYMMTHGFHVLGMATSYTLIFAAPFIATIMSIFVMGEKIRIYRWCAIAAGFTGVLVVLRPGFIPLEPAALGIVLAAFAYATGTMVIRKVGDKEPLLCFSMFGSMAQLIVFGGYMLYKGEMHLPALNHLWFFGATAFIHMFANFAVSRAFGSGEISVVAPFHYVQLLWGVIFGYFIFHNVIDMWTAIGGAIIVGSGIYMIHREHVRHREMTHGVVASGSAVE